MVGLVVNSGVEGLSDFLRTWIQFLVLEKARKAQKSSAAVGSVSLRNTLCGFFGVLFSVCLIIFHNDLVRIDPFFFISCFIFLDPGSENGVVPTQHAIWLYLKPTSHVSQ